MSDCSITKKLSIVPGDITDYKHLARYHYRESQLGPYNTIFAIKAARMPGMIYPQTAGVIVYALPARAVQLRNIALGESFMSLKGADKLNFINENIRNISRVIIEPRFRSLGLANWLVRETLQLVNFPIIESLAVMGHINPFFEKAGMKKYSAPLPARCQQFLEALSAIGIENQQLLDPDFVQKQIDTLPKQQNDFLENQIRIFLQSYGNRKNMLPSLERTKFILSKLTDRPVYYVWFKNESTIIRHCEPTGFVGAAISYS